MAVMVLKNCEVWLDDSTGVFTDGIVKSVTINYESDLQETTAFSTSTGVKGRTYKSGLVNFTIDMDLNQDYAASSVDAILFPLIGSSSFTVRIAVDSVGVDASNPQYTGAVFLESYSPIDGSVGDVAATSITLQGSGVLVRNTDSSSGYTSP
jgi:hypothetical protein